MILQSQISRFRHKLFGEVSIYSLVMIRIAFGLLVLWECYDEIASDIIFESFIEPKIYFKYYGFGWVKVLPGDGMYWLFCLLAALAIFIALGLFYRISIVLFTLGFSYAFLIEQSAYLNHFYMIILFGILLSFMPAHRFCSLDAYFNPQIKSKKISFWPIFLLRAQMEIILLFAGLVKINYDWLIRLQPLKSWLANVDTIAPLNYFFTQDWSVAFAAWGAVILHIVGAPLLLWRRTRIYAFLVYCSFHIMNDHVFQIGSFPWMTIALTTVFFDPNWPQKIFKFFSRNVRENFENYQPLPSSQKQKLIITLSLLWITSQILIPLRYLLYPGDVSWTGEGKRFAWRMKLNSTSGANFYRVTDVETNQQWFIKNDDYLTFAQQLESQCQPDMILQFAHHLRDFWEKEKGYKKVQVHTRAFCGLNERAPILFVNPEVDLARVERNLYHAEWIAPFDKRKNK
jgi:vitamin K-dependent gamma-carboxylase